MEVAEKLNNFFENVVKSLDLMDNSLLLTPVKEMDDPIDIIIKGNTSQ